MKIFLILFSVILSGCFKQTVENKIVNYVETNCKQFPCTVRIIEITDFDWDKMYVFDYGVPFDEIEKVTGTNISVKVEFTRKLIFTRDGKLVRYEELPTDIENIVNNEVVFGDSNNYSHTKIYSAENAIFEAQKYLQGNETYYHLKQKTSEK